MSYTHTHTSTRTSHSYPHLHHPSRHHPHPPPPQQSRVCRNGPSCVHLQRGTCYYTHPEVEARAAVPRDTDETPTCPKCRSALVKKHGDGDFWACPGYPGCKFTRPISDMSCDLCGAGMSKRSGEWGEFYGCSRYPACKGRLTAKQLEKKKNQKKSIEELCKEDLLETLQKSPLEAYLVKAGLPAHGSKIELIMRIQEHLNPDSEKVQRKRKALEDAAEADREAKRRRREQKKLEQALAEERRKQNLKAFMETFIVPSDAQKILKKADFDVFSYGKPPKPFPHSIESSYFPQKHNAKNYECYGVGRTLSPLHSVPEEDDFAVGLSTPSESAKIMFYAPEEGVVLAVLDDLTLSCVKNMESKCPLDNIHMNGGHGGYWNEIFEEDGYVYVFMRDGGWTDSERDWDVSFYIPRSHGEPGGDAWAFRVKKEHYVDAWAKMMDKMSTTSFPALVKANPNFNNLTVEQVNKMKVAELKEELKKRNKETNGLKAVLLERLLKCIQS